MTLRDILRKTSYHSIFNCLYKEYYYKDPDDEVNEMAVAYRRVIGELLNCDNKEKSDYQILIKFCRDEPSEPKGKCADLIDVCLFCIEDEEVYAMDLVPWKDIIEAEIRNETKLKNDCLAAHILWEITFYGFTEEKVLNEHEKLKKQLERIDSGEEKLIPWEDIKED